MTLQIHCSVFVVLVFSKSKAIEFITDGRPGGGDDGDGVALHGGRMGVADAGRGRGGG